MPKFRICDGVCVKAPDGEIYKEGEAIDPAVIYPGGTKDPAFLDHFKNGYIEEYVERSFDPDNPEGGKPLHNQGKWNRDPALLQQKSLEKLNILISEIDPAVAPFETREEAVAHLTQDFRTPEPKAEYRAAAPKIPGGIPPAMPMDPTKHKR